MSGRSPAAGLLLALALLPQPLAGQPAAKGRERPIVDEWREVLAYGIEDEVRRVLEAVEAARERSLAPEMTALVGGSSSPTLRIRVLDALGRMKEPAAERQALALLAADPAPEADLIVACLRYLEAIDSKELGPSARKLVGHDALTVAGTAVRALRKDPEAGALLMEKLRDERTAPELKPDIILVLGEIRHAPAYDELAAIAGDRTQDKTWRTYAAESLGRLGDARAVPLLRSLFGENDALLRAYAAAALGRFAEPGVTELLMEALRDGNWRVRSTGIKALGERKEKAAVDILAYKARRDPVPRVRLDAIAALAQTGARAAMDTLRELLAADGTSPEIRMAALDALLEGDLEASVDTVEKVIAAEWSRETRTNRIVEQAAARLAVRESQRLRGLFERFLDSPNPNVRVAGLRGIVRNRITEQRARVERMSREDPTPGVRKEALLALERL